ncbi:HD domain-containing protein [Apibacter sp. HY039]|uniref:HD domain-containing protein n=1 Tax=Apibacter sp. HY039 TaxID=2501476 RepID=UPI000FEBC71D|nr:HD domain-containing protein [Apibacter sp. HY039]
MSYYQLVQEARQFSIQAHNQQKYGAYPYEIHLGHVVEILIRNGLKFCTEEDYTLLAAAWLHDILEDTTISKEELTRKFNSNISEIVYALTDGRGNTRKEKKKEVYKKIIFNQNAMIVKLADRIANVEFSIIHGNKKKN